LVSNILLLEFTVLPIFLPRFVFLPCLEGEAMINLHFPEHHPDGTPIEPKELPDSLPAYLINVRPELRLNGEVAATGATIGLGTTETFTIQFY